MLAVAAALGGRGASRSSGCAIWHRQASAAMDLRGRCARLDTPGPATFRRCGRPKARMAGAIMDASAMYERFVADQVLAAADCVLDVQRCRQLRGRPIRTWGLPQCGAFRFPLDGLLVVLRASWIVTFAMYGDEVFRQVGGPPRRPPLRLGCWAPFGLAKGRMATAVAAATSHVLQLRERGTPHCAGSSRSSRRSRRC